MPVITELVDGEARYYKQDGNNGKKKPMHGAFVWSNASADGRSRNSKVGRVAVFRGGQLTHRNFEGPINVPDSMLFPDPTQVSRRGNIIYAGGNGRSSEPVVPSLTEPVVPAAPVVCTSSPLPEAELGGYSDWN